MVMADMTDLPTTLNLDQHLPYLLLSCLSSLHPTLPTAYILLTSLPSYPKPLLTSPRPMPVHFTTLISIILTVFSSMNSLSFHYTPSTSCLSHITARPTLTAMLVASIKPVGVTVMVRDHPALVCEMLV